jgi:dihydroflavonol-4-reductase
MKALVTGSTGFIGSHLVEALLEKKIETTCLVRMDSNLKWIKDLPVHFIAIQDFEKNSLIKAVKGMDYIFHVGAVIHARSPEIYRQVNVQNTEMLLKACEQANPKITKFVLVSSISAAGPGNKGVYRCEKHRNHPVSDYGRSKLMAESAVLEHRKRIPVAIIRPPNVIGPRQKELYDVIRLIKKRLIPQIGNGDKQTSICYVEDVVQAMILLAEKKEANGQIYCVTDGQTYAWREITGQIAIQLGIGRISIKIPLSMQKIIVSISGAVCVLLKKPASINGDMIQQSMTSYWLFDDSKIRKELGFQSKTGMPAAIRKTIAWYRDRKLI